MRRSALIISVLGSLALSACEPDPRAVEPVLPDGFENKLVLLDMLRRGEFDALDTRLTALQAAFEAGDVSEESVLTAFHAFMNTDPTIR